MFEKNLTILVVVLVVSLALVFVTSEIAAATADANDENILYPDDEDATEVDPYEGDPEASAEHGNSTTVSSLNSGTLSSIITAAHTPPNTAGKIQKTQGTSAPQKAHAAGGTTTLSKTGLSSTTAAQDNLELEFSNAIKGINNTLTYVLNKQALKSCQGNPHPFLIILNMLKKKGIYEEFEEKMCQVDYHFYCLSPEWKNCKVLGATKFCPKSCNIINCHLLKSHGSDYRTQPIYRNKENCRDNVAIDCAALQNRGDCFAMPAQLSDLCPKTCGFCDQNKLHAPFIPEMERLFLWLSNFKGGKYSKYATLLAIKEIELKNKAMKNVC